MRIMGIDPGTRICGYGVIETDGGDARVLDYGTIRKTNAALPARLKVIYEGLCAVVAQFSPDVAVVEGTFTGKNMRTALKIGEGRGVALLAAASCGVDVVEYSPATVKKSVVGHGRAHKSQVQQMVRLILNLSELPEPEDAADALALAICHFHRLSASPS